MKVYPSTAPTAQAQPHGFPQSSSVPFLSQKEAAIDTSGLEALESLESLTK